MRTNGIITWRLGVSSRTRASSSQLEREEVGLAHVAVATAVADHRVGFDAARISSPPVSSRNSLVRKSIVRYTTGRGANARVIRASDAAIAVDELGSPALGEQRLGCSPPSASVTMNSARSSPTPSTGERPRPRPRSPIAQVDVEARAERLDREAGADAAVAGQRPPARRAAELRRVRHPRTRRRGRRRRSRARRRGGRRSRRCAPTTHGTRSSRLTIAAWQVTPPPLGDERAGTPHRRHPVGSRHRRHQHLARLGGRRVLDGAHDRGHARRRCPGAARATVHRAAAPARPERGRAVVIGRDCTRNVPSADAPTRCPGARRSGGDVRGRSSRASTISSSVSTRRVGLRSSRAVAPLDAVRCPTDRDRFVPTSTDSDRPGSWRRRRSGRARPRLRRPPRRARTRPR